MAELLGSNVVPISREAAEAQLRRALAILKEEVHPPAWDAFKAREELSGNGEWDEMPRTDGEIC